MTEKGCTLVAMHVFLSIVLCCLVHVRGGELPSSKTTAVFNKELTTHRFSTT